MTIKYIYVLSSFKIIEGGSAHRLEVKGPGGSVPGAGCQFSNVP